MKCEDCEGGSMEGRYS